MSDAFISYSRKNTEFAQRLVSALRDRSYDYWLDERDAHRSPDWWSEIQAGINSADNFLVVLSQESLCSSVCHLELDHALSLNKRIVVIALKDKTDLNLAQALGVVAADDDPIIRQMAAGKDVLMVARSNWGALNKPTWVFFRDEDNFEEAFDHLMEVVETDHRHVRAHTRLLESAEEWQARNREVSLLLIGTELDEAQAWLLAADEDHEKMPRPTNLQREYIARSEQVEKQRIEEEKRRSAELHAAKEQAEDAVSQAQTAAERAERATAESNAAAERAKQARRLALVVGAVALTIALLAGGFTLLVLNNARESTTSANQTVQAANAEIGMANAMAAAAATDANQAETAVGVANATLTPIAISLTQANIERATAEYAVSNVNAGLAVQQAQLYPIGDPIRLSLAVEAMDSYPTVQPVDGGSLLLDSLDVSVQVPLQTYPVNPLDVQMSPDRDSLLLQFSDGTFSLANAADGSLTTYLGANSGARWSRDSDSILTWDGSGNLAVRDASNGIRQVEQTIMFEDDFGSYPVSLQDALWNPDETLVAAWNDTAGVYVWDPRPPAAVSRVVGSEQTTASARQPIQLVGAERDVTNVDTVSWSSDGSRLFISYSLFDGSSYNDIFNATTGARLLSLGTSSNSYSLGSLWSADDRNLLTWGYYDDTPIAAIHVWDSETGAEVNALAQDVRTFYATWNADRSRLLVQDENGAVYLWDWNNGEPILLKMYYPDAYFDEVLWNADGTRVLAYSTSGETAVVLDGESLQEMATLRSQLVGAIWDVNQTDALTWAYDVVLRRWLTEDASPDLNPDILTNSFMLEAQWNNAGTQVLTLSEDGAAAIWDSATGDLVRILDHNTDYADSAYYNAPFAARWSSDDRLILTWSYDQMARMWDAATGELIWARQHTQHADDGITETPDAVAMPAWSHDGSRVITWSSDYDFFGEALTPTVYIWDAETGEQMLELPQTTIAGAAWNANDTQFATWSADGSVQVYDAATGDLLQTLNHPSAVSGVRWNSDGTTMLTWTQEGVLREWDVLTGTTLAEMRHENSITDAFWNRDETRLFSSSMDRTARIWDAQNGALLAVLPHIASVRGVSANSDETGLLTWSNDGTAALWDSATGERRQTYQCASPGYGYRAIHAGFSPDGRRLFVVCDDGYVRVFDVGSGQRLFTLPLNYLTGAQWSPDGEHLLIWGNDFEARIWWTDIPAMLELARQTAQPLSNEQRAAVFLPTLAFTPAPSPTMTSVPQRIEIPAHIGQQSGGYLVNSVGELWTYEGQAGEVVTIRTISDVGANRLDSQLFIYDPNGNFLAGNDDVSAYIITESLIANLTLPMNGIYTIEVREFEGDFQNTAGSYALDIISSRMTPTPTLSPTPTLTPSDTPTMRPTPTAVAGAQNGFIPVGGGESWLYDGQAGEAVSFQVFAEDDWDTFLNLYAPDGSLLTSNDDFNGFNSQIDVTLAETGTYRVEVRSFNDFYGGNYDLNIVVQPTVAAATPTPSPTATATP